MPTIVLYIILVFVAVIGISVYIISTNLKKNPGWLYLVICTCGLALGILLGSLRRDIYSGLQVGIVITLLSIFGGLIGRLQRQKFTELEDWYKKRFKK
jgi:hypothetical protein